MMSKRYSISDREKHDLAPEDVLSDAYGAVSRRLEKPIEQRHFFIFAGFIAICIVVVLLRMFWLTIVRFEVYADIAEQNRIREIVLPASRGLIYDRVGRLLLHNIPVVDLVTDPAELPKDARIRQDRASQLANVLHDTPSEQLHLDVLTQTTSVKSSLIAERLEARDAIRFAAHEDAFTGIELRVTPSREYRDGEALYHVAGFVGRAAERDLAAGYLPSDFVGKGGVEASYESVLRGEHGKERFEVDGRGNVLRTLGRLAPKNGQSVVLALDTELQRYSHDAMTKVVRSRRSPGGAMVAVDPRDGAILALVSVPSVDANILAQGISQKAYQKILTDERHPFFNRALSARYPAGSTIKPILGAAALAENIVQAGTIIQDNGAITIPDIYNPSVIYTFRGYAALGPTDIYSAIALSSDIYFYTVGGGFGGIKGLGVERIEKHLRIFGFGETLGIDMPGENFGLVPTPAWKETIRGERWRVGDTYNISIGQGDLGVTMLQLAVATAAIANGGTLWQPRLALRTIDENFSTIRTYDPHAIRTNIAPPDDLAVIRKAMRGTVMYGTAKILQQLPIAAAAKTGTAQTGKNSPYHALVTVFAPYENPEIVLALIVEKAGEGSEVAVPLARDILAEYFRRGS